MPLLWLLCLASVVISEVAALSLMPLGDSITLGCGDAATLDNATLGCGASCPQCGSNFNCSTMPLGPDRKNASDHHNNTCPAWNYGRTCHGGYRTRLYALLEAAGYAARMTGPIQTGPLSLSDAAVSHAGFPGATIVEIGGSWDGDDLFGLWTSPQYQPDLIISHCGVNDMWGAFWDPSVTDAAAIIASYLDMLNRTTLIWPTTGVLVSTITEMPTQILMALQLGGNPAAAHVYADFQARLPGMVAALQALGRRVFFADVAGATQLCPVPPPDPEYPYGGISGLCCVNDDVHPTAAGYDRFAAAWFDAISKLVGPPPGAVPPLPHRVEAPVV